MIARPSQHFRCANCALDALALAPIELEYLPQAAYLGGLAI